MSPAEITFTETLVHSIVDWSFENDHLLDRMLSKGVTKKDAAITCKWGEVIAVQSNGRIVLRLMKGMRKGVVIVVSLSDRMLVTAWYNKPTDNHATLDLSQYAWQVNVIEYLRSIQ
jgi:hypothetical protein